MCINTDPTHREICHALVGAHLWLNVVFGSDVHTNTCRECVQFCTFMYMPISTFSSVTLLCMSTYKHVWEQGNICVYISPHTDTNIFLKSKAKSACPEGLFKHKSWKIYGSLELNCVSLLLEKDRWGLSRDMFYQFDCLLDVCSTIGVMQRAFYCNSIFDLEVSVFGS